MRGFEIQKTCDVINGIITVFKEIVSFIRTLYPHEETVPLHAPRFAGNEKEYLTDCIDSTYVSYVGQYVSRFEDQIKRFTGARYAVATVNGTAALHTALLLAGVDSGDEVITQPLTFVATVNAISYCGAHPVFVDVGKETLGLDPESLQYFLKQHGHLKTDGYCYNKETGRRIAACVPMHTFGHPCQIDHVVDICKEFNILVVEDAAESLGSLYHGRHTGLFGDIGILSFNGNKPVTTGGGGAMITNIEDFAVKAKHLTTTAKKPHLWEFNHDSVGYNYRMPNINAAVGCAQMEYFTGVLENKRTTANMYNQFFRRIGIPFITEPAHARSNYWLNAICMKDAEERDALLKYCNVNGVTARPVWLMMNKLNVYKKCQTSSLDVAEWFEERIVNLPSSVRV